MSTEKKQKLFALMRAAISQDTPRSSDEFSSTTTQIMIAKPLTIKQRAELDSVIAEEVRRGDWD